MEPRCGPRPPSHLATWDSAGLCPPTPPGTIQMEVLETRCLRPERGSGSWPGLRTCVVRGRTDGRPHSRPSAPWPCPRMRGCCCEASRGRGGTQTTPLPSGVLTRAALRAFYVGRSFCDPGGFEGQGGPWKRDPAPRHGEREQMPTRGPAGLGRRAEAPTEPSPGTRQMALHTRNNTRWLLNHMHI